MKLLMQLAAAALLLMPGRAMALPGFEQSPAIPYSAIGVAGGVAPIGSGAAPVYTGEVATRATLASSWAANTTGNSFNARSAHYARQSITTLQVGFSNFANILNAGEEGNGSAATVTGAIEYPAGVFTQLKFSGTAQGVIANDSYLVSDFARVLIPNGAKFWVREWYSNPNGFPYAPFISPPGSQMTNIGDLLQWGTGVADMTMGGTLTNSGSTSYSYPIAIVAPTTQAAACLFGDSRMLGLKDVRNDATGDGGPISRAIGPRYPYILLATGSDTVGGTLAATANRVSLSKYCSFGIDEYGINDLYNNNNLSSAVISNLNTFNALFPSLQMYGATLEPESTSTDSWATTGNQTISNTTNNTARLAVNSAIRAGLATELNYLDIAHMIDPNDTGIWPATGAAGGCTIDGIHENTASAILSTQATACGAFYNILRNIDFSRR